MKGYPPMFCNIIKTFLQSQEKNSPTVRASDACSNNRLIFAQNLGFNSPLPMSFGTVAPLRNYGLARLRVFTQKPPPKGL